MRQVLMWVLGIVGLLVVAAVIAFLVIDWEERGEQLLSETLGREVQIGSLDIQPGWTTTVHVGGLKVENTDWAEADHMVTLGEGTVAVKIWPLVTGELEFPEIVLREPKIHLAKKGPDKVNWRIGGGDGGAGGDAVPDQRGEFPAIGRLVIEDGLLTYKDATRDLDVTGKLSTVKADASGDDSVTASLKGTLQGRPVMLDFSGGSMVHLQETDKPYPVDFELRSGETRISAEGTLTDPVKVAGIDIELSIEGPTLADIFPIVNIPLPDTPPYSLDGALAKEGERWRFENFSGVVGDSDLSGSVMLDNGRKPPFVEADLVSQKLDFADLAGLIGLDPEEPAPETKEGIFPDTPINADRLHTMNMDVRFKGTEVLAPNLPIERLRFRVQVTDGRALFRPLSMVIAKGTISGEAALNARQEVPSADVDLTFKNLSLKPFLKGSQFVQDTGGRFFGHIYLLGVGRTVDQMMATARGQGSIAMRDGAISGLIVEAAGLDVMEALTLVVGDDAGVPIRCARIDLDAKDGTLNVERGVVDTTDSLLVSKGNVDLGQEKFDVQVEARAKDFSLIDFAAPVRAYGPFTDPSVSIGGLDPLPFFEMGDQNDIDCASLISDAVGRQFDKDTKK